MKQNNMSTASDRIIHSHPSAARRQRRKWQSAKSRRLLLESLENRLMLTEVAPLFTKAFAPDTIGPGSVSTLTFTITEQGGSATTDMAFTDTLPAGVTIATPSNASTNCIEAVLSAPNGGSTISFSQGKLGASLSCTVSVDVTSSTVGTHMNTSSVLTSNHPDSLTASDNLMVATDRPGFTKVFSPSSVNLGGRSVLTFTIDNTANGSSATTLNFTDNLPIGMVIANPSAASTDCGDPLIPAVLTATPGSSVITLDADGFGGFPALAAGATCTVEVDVVSTGTGSLGNLSGELLAFVGGQSLSSGKASAMLDVTAEKIHLKKDFLADPVPAGGTVDVEFTITNFDRDFTATGVAFTDDLNATLMGLVATGLPIAACGGTLSGTDTITLTGATVAAGSSCMFTVALQVPVDAEPGDYVNTTSTISATIDGMGVVGAPAVDFLFVEPVPVLTKEFLEVGTFVPDPIVNAGDDVVIRFTVTNTSTTSSATDVAFLDDISSFFPLGGPSVLPSDPCGSGSSIVIADGGFDNAVLTLSGGTLAEAGMPGDSCAFDVTLTLPGGLGPGLYVNTTDAPTATVEGGTRMGQPASDTLTVIAAPNLTKAFTDDPVAPGSSVTLEFTLEYSPDATGDATAISFTDDLAPVLAGLVATGLPLAAACDPDGPGGAAGTGTLSGSAGDTLLTFAGGSLMPGESCTFSVTLDVPAGAAAGTFANTTSGVSATVEGLPATSAPASDDLRVQGLKFTKEFLDDSVIPGDTTTLRFTIQNVHPTDNATGISFSDDLSEVLPGPPPDITSAGPPTVNTCGGSEGGTSTVLLYTGGSLDTGQTCTIEYTINVPAGADDGTYINVTSNLSATQGVGVTIAPASDSLTLNSELIGLSKVFTDDPVAPGDNVTLEFTLTNLDPAQAASMIDFTDDFGAVLAGVTFDSEDFNDCGATIGGLGTGALSVTGASLGAGGSCTIRTTLTVPGGAAANIYTNTTSAVTGTIGGLAVNGVAASDDLEVIQLLGFSKSFNGPTTATGTPVLTFTITNPGVDSPTGLAFSDDLDAVIPGLVATNLPLSDVCGTGSLLSGTSVLTLTGGELGPIDSCTFDVELLVPGTATAGTFPNATSVLTQNGLKVSEPATANLVVEPPPTFAKAFAPDMITDDVPSRLTFTIDNTASAVAANGLSFVDNFPAGVIIADPTNASTTCAGGMGDATPGATSFTFTGGTVGANAICTVELDVTSTAGGVFVNTTGDLTSSSGNSGTATDTLTACDTHVTNTNDIGLGSLRDAIICANTFAGVDTIDFNIAGAGPHTITPLSPLPLITDIAIIDGTTEPDFAGTPVVELNGSSAGAGANGLTVAPTGAGSTIRGLVINRFNGSGILLAGGSGNFVEGNFIGTGTNGTTDLGNNLQGVFVSQSSGNTIGGTTVASRNVISGNNQHGVLISGVNATGNVLQGNFIGTRANGAADLGNRVDGVVINNAANNTIGGTAPGTRNIISGNDRYGVQILGAGGTGNLIRGNFIGTGVTGATDVGNSLSGVKIGGASNNVIGGTGPAARNVISGNDGVGVLIADGNPTGNLVQGNFIGTDNSGALALGNSLDGVNLNNGLGNTIGGTAAGAGNTIAFNGRDGIRAAGTGIRAAIQRNSIFSNVGLGIELGVDGATPNDANDPDTGPNQLQNFPVLSNAVPNGSNVLITYSVPSIAPNSVFPLTVEFFLADPAGQEGRIFLGSDSYAQGTAPTAVIPNGGAVPGKKILATATDANGNTSEFSGTVMVKLIVNSPGDTDDGDITNGVTTLREAINFANTNPIVETIFFDIAGAGPHTITPLSALPAITDPVSIDGTSEPNFAGTPIVELNGSSAGGAANGLTIAAGGAGSTIRGLAINRFGGSGIAIFGGSGSKIEGNFIGTGIGGTTDLGNTAHGVFVSQSSSNMIGGATAAARNVISGNDQHGVLISGVNASGNLVQGNFIGTRANGTVDLGNSFDGIFVNNGPNNTIGGTAPGTRNVISGNDRDGVQIIGTSANGNLIRGNFIGTDVTGTADVGNTVSGVKIGGASGNTIGGTAPAARNVISGNDGAGVLIADTNPTGNLVQGNFIGTDNSGALALGNTLDGVNLNSGLGNTIGGTVAGADNKIAFNGRDGVRAAGTGIRAAIQRNSIFSNVGLGIDLNGNGVTPNDADDPDAGPNNLQNFPVLSSAVLSGGDVQITFSVPSITPNSAFQLLVEFYRADPAGEEGRIFLGSRFYSQNTTPTVTLPNGGAVAGTKIVATATDANGNTSEFSANVTVANPLLAAGGPVSSSTAASLTQDDLNPIIGAALTRFAAAGLAAQQLASLSQVQFAIADLPGATLGSADGRTVTLDANAAGHGWFIDPTPLDDSEFTSGSRLSTLDSQHRMDLLSAVMHELGHELGHADLDPASHADELMSATLAPGTRSARTVDEIFGSGAWND